MQFELALSESPAAAVMTLWEQLDPIVRQTVIDRLALAPVKAALPPEQHEEDGTMSCRPAARRRPPRRPSQSARLSSPSSRFLQLRPGILAERT